MIKLIIDSTIQWDERLFHCIFAWNGKHALDITMLTITRTADGYYYPMVIPIVWLLEETLLLPLLLSVAIAFTLELPLYLVIKKGVKRVRPYKQFAGIQFLIPPPDEFSFPSGHTTAAFLMALVLSSYLPAITLPVFTWASLVGTSRVYLGVHYPSDVLAGAVLGISCGMFGLAII